MKFLVACGSSIEVSNGRPGMISNNRYHFVPQSQSDYATANWSLSYTRLSQLSRGQVSDNTFMAPLSK